MGGVRRAFIDDARLGVPATPTPGPGPALTAELVAEAVVRAAMATGELTLLSYRDEQALKGHVAFRARWVALAALMGLCPRELPSRIGRLLGCSSHPLPGLLAARSQGWWDEAVPGRLLADLAGAPDRRPLTGLEGLTRVVAGLVDHTMTEGERG